MIVTRRDYHLTTTALRASLAPHFAYDIPSDQPARREVPASIVERTRALGIGKLAVMTSAGRA